MAKKKESSGPYFDHDGEKETSLSFPNPPDLVPVEFLINYMGYAPGEIAGFKPEIAKDLCAKPSKKTGRRIQIAKAYMAPKTKPASGVTK